MNREEMLLEVWKTTIDVQKHFNELELRIRNFAVTVLAAFLAAAGFSVRESLHLDILGTDVSLTGLLLLSGTFVWLAFYGMDRFWYHRLLKGAVDHGRAVEAALSSTLPEIELTSAIGRASPVMLGKMKFDSNRKMDWFYRGIALLLVSAAVVAFIQPPETRSSGAPKGASLGVAPSIQSPASTPATKGKGGGPANDRHPPR